MKKIFVLILFCIIIFPVNCQAINYPYHSVTINDLKYFIGDWYDTKGNLVLSITNNYKLNGFTIIELQCSKGSAPPSPIYYKITIDEGNKYKTLEIQTEGWQNGRCKFIFMNPNTYNEIGLRCTKNPSYFESIGGIYLGMDKYDVLKLYGQPSKTDKNSFTYEKQGFSVGIKGNIVTSIVIYTYGDRRFDWSGLSARNSKADFHKKYGSKRNINSDNLYIGYGEKIFIYNDKIVLKYPYYDET